jgi:uroporphyrinogen-III synthase
VGTASLRRRAQLLALRPDLQVSDLRGNVDTRLRRLTEGDVDALILAAAGLERLGRLDEVDEFLSFDLMLPAPGQGALVLQVVEGSAAATLAAAVDDPPTSRAVLAERELLRTLGGGCLSAIGAYALVEAGELSLRAVVLDSSGRRMLKAQSRGRNDEAVIAEVADQLQEGGVTGLLNSGGGVLAGLRVLVTRADGQAADLAGALEAEGAAVLSCPVIAIEPIDIDLNRLEASLDAQWLVLTSANGAERWFELLRSAELAFPTHIKVASIGPQTAASLRRHGVEPAFVPEKYLAEDLADGLATVITPGSRVLLARAAGSREVLPERLRAAGLEVEILETYRAVSPPGLRQRLSEALPGVDLVTFTSSSTVRHFVDAIGTRLDAQTRVACIGPVTAETARALELRVDIIAEEFTARGLVDAIVRSRAPAFP